MPVIITHTASTSACEKRVGPERALELFDAMQKQQLILHIITHIAAISVCEKRAKPEGVLGLLAARLER